EVLAIENDQVLEAAGDEQLTVAGDPQVATAQPALAVSLDEGVRGGLRVLPVALGDACPGDPDFTDLPGRQHLLSCRVNNAQVVVVATPAAPR
nr:hypothetical protein [Tanacetum cinerariifolium]